MSIVNPNVGAGVGNLLRLAEERDQQNQLLNKPAALPTSPLRQLVRTTMLSPLSPGSARIVGVNPEPIIPTEVQPSVGINAAMGQGVAPRAPEPTGATPRIAQPSAPTMGGGGAVPQGNIAQPSAPTMGGGGAVPQGNIAQGQPVIAKQPGVLGQQATPSSGIKYAPGFVPGGTINKTPGSSWMGSTAGIVGSAVSKLNPAALITGLGGSVVGKAILNAQPGGFGTPTRGEQLQYGLAQLTAPQSELRQNINKYLSGILNKVKGLMPNFNNR